MGSQGVRVTLEYPNGRMHQTTLGAYVEPGTEFELYGRRWRAVGPLLDWRQQRVRWDDRDVVLCKSLGRVAELDAA